MRQKTSQLLTQQRLLFSFQLPKSNSCHEIQVQTEFRDGQGALLWKFFEAISENIPFTYWTIVQKQVAIISDHDEYKISSLRKEVISMHFS